MPRRYAQFTDGLLETAGVRRKEIVAIGSDSNGKMTGIAHVHSLASCLLPLLYALCSMLSALWSLLSALCSPTVTAR
jgi:hypothetical protein